MSGELTRRVLFSVVAIPITIAILLFGDWPLAALLAVTSAIGAWEFFRIATASGSTPLADAGVAIAGLIPLVVYARFLGLYDPETSVGTLSLIVIILLVLLGLSIWLRGAAGKPLGAVASTALGAAYTGGMLSYAYAIRYHPYAFAPAILAIGGFTMPIPSGGLLLLLPVLLTWASDIGAYAIGRTLGTHKLIPSVCLGKTVEGAVGGLAAAMLLAWVYAKWVLHPASHLDFHLAPFGALGFGALVSLSAQVGDLVESLLKREGGVKDSSHLIPGHGGVLDRCDSLLFVLPVSYVLLSRMLTWVPT